MAAGWFERSFNFEWSTIEVDLYKELQTGNDRFAGYKNLIAILTLIASIGFWSVNFYFPIKNNNAEFSKDWYWAIPVVVLLVNIISMCIHLRISYSIIKKGDPTYKIKLYSLVVDYWKKLNLKAKILFFVKFLIFPDYFWAEFFKGHIGSHFNQKDLISIKEMEFVRLLKKFYIERCNWANLSFTMLGSLLMIYSLGGGNGLTGIIPYTLFIFIAYRSVSRTMEILIAFYNDILKSREKIFFKNGTDTVTLNNDKLDVDPRRRHENLRIINNPPREIRYIYPWKNSLLLPSSRASLAIHSLLEIIMLFALLYFLMVGVSDYIFIGKDAPTLPEGLEGDIGIIKYFIFSFSVAVTLPDIESTLWAIPLFMQILSSLVLMIMSLAYYLGKEHDIKGHEKQLYGERARENVKRKFR
ncbi:hypothetical protein PAECIP111892_04643 [Paenibacillus auburnensis]|uniref:Uncharacterized protein n=1 Tax=Paenibacillus auburnensis TaxID=2905649 RepID=A0ABN8GXR1_9BACL|nr:hypothetical protein [Paenibacillus auburnensis]CAH1219002.1 hypothetical protein PAECIP111892_04643 [Paenibacillus auburnensis]